MSTIDQEHTPHAAPSLFSSLISSWTDHVRTYSDEHPKIVTGTQCLQPIAVTAAANLEEIKIANQRRMKMSMQHVAMLRNIIVHFFCINPETTITQVADALNLNRAVVSQNILKMAAQENPPRIKVSTISRDGSKRYVVTEHADKAYDQTLVPEACTNNR